MGVSNGSDVAGRNPVGVDFSIYSEASVYSATSVDRIPTSQLPLKWRHAAISIGNFDGVHRGHQRLIQRLRNVSRRLAAPAMAIAVTFDPPPGVFLSHGAISAPLTTLSRKVALLRQAGADVVWVLKTTPELLALSPETFFQRILLDQLQTQAVVEGSDFRFGVQRTGTVETLQSLCKAQNISLHIVSPLLLTDFKTTSYDSSTSNSNSSSLRVESNVCVLSNGDENSDLGVESGFDVPLRPFHVETRGTLLPSVGRRPDPRQDTASISCGSGVDGVSEGVAVSSSRIRRQIRAGEIANAAWLLGRYHELSGIVVHGEHRGRTLGYPTANLAQIPELLPPDGVYAGRVTLPGTEDTVASQYTENTEDPSTRSTYSAAVAIGPNTTFDGTERKCEIHLLNFHGDLYGKPLRLELVAKIREMRRFETVTELLAQMAEDVQATTKAVDGAADSAIGGAVNSGAVNGGEISPTVR